MYVLQALLDLSENTLSGKKTEGDAATVSTLSFFHFYSFQALRPGAGVVSATRWRQKLREASS